MKDLDFTLLQDLAYEVQTEVMRATKKHGNESMALNDDPSKRLAILGEEYGEVCRALTYDNNNPENLRSELIQTAAMAIAWVYALETQSQKSDEVKCMKVSETPIRAPILEWPPIGKHIVGDGVFFKVVPNDDGTKGVKVVDERSVISEEAVRTIFGLPIADGYISEEEND
jgi:NTP pyrophosphatase (non-canonical NTP hydrolase)